MNFICLPNYGTDFEYFSAELYLLLKELVCYDSVKGCVVVLLLRWILISVIVFVYAIWRKCHSFGTNFGC